MSKFPRYGRLAMLDFEGMQAGASEVGAALTTEQTGLRRTHACDTVGDAGGERKDLSRVLCGVVMCARVAA